jgi:hypothetical protein
MTEFVNIYNFSTQFAEFGGQCTFAGTRFASNAEDDALVIRHRQIDVIDLYILLLLSVVITAIPVAPVIAIVSASATVAVALT